jgi:hypothetical protein
MAILNCPGCDRGGLRVPDGRRGKVTCPTCGAEWFYPETIELSEVEFRCSGSGARFVVVLARRSPLHQFVIHAIKNAAPPASGPVSANEGSQHHPSVAAPSSSASLPPPRATGWLTRITNLKGHRAAIERSAVARHPAPAHSLTTYDAKEYNWSSFLCPYCRAAGFVKCGGGHLACDGSVQVRNGGRFHLCFCGNAGYIFGTIESISGTASTLTDRPEAATKMDHDTLKISSGSNATGMSQPGVSSPKPALPK